jgi:Zn finger protein HypA/HybF involved in hydrogenase expression
MGQAKQRGSLEQRILAAKDRMAELRPKSITCNECQAEITDVQDMDTQGMDGIEAAFAGICPKCDSSTYAVRGRREAVEAFMMAMAKATGEVPLLGTQ